jgi:hypothetical protein
VGIPSIQGVSFIVLCAQDVRLQFNTVERSSTSFALSLGISNLSFNGISTPYIELRCRIICWFSDCVKKSLAGHFFIPKVFWSFHSQSFTIEIVCDYLEIAQIFQVSYLPSKGIVVLKPS